MPLDTIHTENIESTSLKGPESGLKIDNQDMHAARSISTYKPQPGDFALWDKTLHLNLGTSNTMHLEHSGVIGKDGSIMYAGSDVTHGYNESDFKGMCNAPTFTCPSVILRSKHLAQ
jgi:hypothetical protein